VVGKNWQDTNVTKESNLLKGGGICQTFCYETFPFCILFWDDIIFFNEICLFVFILKSINVFVKVITWHFIVVHNWINIMVKIVKPQGMPWKMLGGNLYSFKSHWPS
jgi:hypothetical protein